MERLGCTATVVVLDPHTLEDVLDGISAVGRAAGVEDRADRCLGSLRARLAAVADRTAGLPRPRVFVLEWPDPPFLAGHWVPDLVAAAGGEAVLARSGQRSVPTTFEAIADADPDVVVVASCGFDLDGTSSHAAEVLSRLPWRAAVWAVDANAVMVRPGPRLVDGVEVLADLLHGGRPDAGLARPVRPASPVG
jgi:iron complex transport system substrate-binding protein